MAIELTYFVHGTTTDNEKGLSTGWAHGELSELGIEQAKGLGPLVANKKFDVIFCSDLKRAVDSAHYAFPNRYDIIEDERLRECNYGDFNEVHEHSFKSDMTKYIKTPFPSGESYQDVEKRIRSFVDNLKESYADKHVGIVAHQAPQLALDVILRGMTWEEAIANDWRKVGAWQPGWEYTLA